MHTCRYDINDVIQFCHRYIYARPSPFPYGIRWRGSGSSYRRCHVPRQYGVRGHPEYMLERVREYMMDVELLMFARFRAVMILGALSVRLK